MGRPSKRVKLLEASDESNSEDEGGVSLKVNQEYANRFEFNKKREERQRLEEKYGKSKAFRNGDAEHDEPSDEDSESEDEDDAAELITEELDDEILSTLNALRSKDPRVYDKSFTFYKESEDGEAPETNGTKKEKAMTLRDYHTKNLLEGNIGSEDEDNAPPKTYAQEQEDVRQDLVKSMHIAADGESEDEDNFLIAKSKPEPPAPTRVRPQITDKDVEEADRDPETFLSNFMASRAWVPTTSTDWKPLESDDDEEVARAEDFEAAYNMYFEDPSTANEKLVTYARDTIASTSVRREETSSRKKAREAARAKREAEKKEREEGLARLRKLKIEETEEKVKKIRKTAGLSGRDFNMEEWRDVLEADWSDDQWDKEMQRRFGETYYDEQVEEQGSGSDEEADGAKKKSKKPKKPKWDDDIDINDLVPNFEDDDDEKPTYSLTSDEETDAEANEDLEDDISGPSSKPKTSKQRKQERASAKSSARRDRRLIESLVDDSLSYEAALASSSFRKTKTPTRFRYRETSPTNFGMTARDILLANDAQLNQFAGLKKLASFRDPVKKRKDKKFLGKKRRLREWRKETFGDEEGVGERGFEVLLGDEADQMEDIRGGQREVPNGDAEGAVDVRDGKRKKKRSRKRKADTVEA